MYMSVHSDRLFFVSPFSGLVTDIHQLVDQVVKALSQISYYVASATGGSLNLLSGDCARQYDTSLRTSARARVIDADWSSST